MLLSFICEYKIMYIKLKMVRLEYVYSQKYLTQRSNISFNNVDSNA